jgi:hypothetical protein
MKRLIEAAREVVAAADKCQDWNGTHLGHTLSELRIAISAAEQQAADGGEPITEEWLCSLKEENPLVPSTVICCTHGLMVTRVGCIIMIEARAMPHIKTRGQLRQLVELLKGDSQ